jgi:hypothetical protein
MSATGQHERSLPQALRRNHLLTRIRNKTSRRVYFKLVTSLITRSQREKADYSAPAVRLYNLQTYRRVHGCISYDNCDFTPSWLCVISPELPAWHVAHKNREICKKPPTRKLQSLISVKLYRVLWTGRNRRHGLYVEYQATMESCSDKFRVDIPNVV